MRLQKKTVWDAVKSWALIYHLKRTEEEEKAVAIEFFFTLQDEMSNDEFMEASRLIKKTSRFFPTIADIFGLKDAAVNAMRRRSFAEGLLLPAPAEKKLSEEETIKSAKMYNKLIELANSGLTHEAMAQEMERFRVSL